MLSPKLLVLLSLSLILHICYAQVPGWCAAAQGVQQGQDFSLCATHNANNANDVLLKRSSWCDKANYHAALPISLKDPDFRDNCNKQYAHCFPDLSDLRVILDNPICVDDTEQEFTFNPAPLVDNVLPRTETSYKKRCKVIHHTIPFEIFTTAGNRKREFLVVSTSIGFAILDMSTESVLFQQITNEDIFTFTKVVSGSSTNNAHIIGAGGNSVVDYKFEYDNAGIPSLKKMGRVTIQDKKIVDLDAFSDKASNHKYAVVAVANAEGATEFIRFYQLGQTDLNANSITWTVKNLAATTLFRLKALTHRTFDRTAAAANVQCGVEKDQRTLISIATSTDVFIFGFVNSVGNTNVDLSAANNAGKALYYTAPQNSQISAFAVWGECFGNWALSSQGLWLSVGLHNTNTGANSMKLYPITEFAYADFDCYKEQADGWMAPSSSVRDAQNKCEQLPACPNAPAQYRKRAENGDFNCADRIDVAPVTLSDKPSDIVAKLSTDTKANTQPQELVFAYITHLFVAAAKHVNIYSFQEIACAQDSKPVVELMNTVDVQNHINSIAVSKNAQHMFLSVYKKEWEILAIKRYYDACTAYKANPTKTEVQQFKDICTQYLHSNYTIYDYIFYYSQCNNKWYCPQFGDVKTSQSDIDFEVLTVDPGKHTLRPLSIHTCEPGFYCPSLADSRRVVCPSGFKCPTLGLTAPVPCKTGDRYEKSCIQTGLTSEAACPDGFICFDPYSMVPVPPGFYSTYSNRKLLNQCAMGQLCSIATHNETVYGRYPILCPVGYYCPQPDIIEPFVCHTTYDAKGEKIANYTMFCGAGTFRESLCPAGYKCPTPLTYEACEDGYYCPSGTQEPLVCPAGYYCPTPTSYLECPVGYFCREGTTNPQKCQYLVYCPRGTSKPVYAFGAILIDIGILLVALVAFIVIRLIQRDIRKKRDKKRKAGEQASLLANSGLGAGLNIASAALGAADEEEQEDQGPLILDRKKYTMDFTLKDVSFIRKKNEKVIFAGVNAKIKHGNLTCILSQDETMSETLIDVLAGKAWYGYIDGAVEVNGVPEDMTKFKNIVGYVEESPIMHTNFKVKEILRFAAHIRLPSTTTVTQITRKVRQTIHVFGLEDLADYEVGRLKHHGMSAPQRKLVHIASEAIAEPAALFLVNPTAGLDVMSAKKVMTVLKEIAESGTTVVCKISRLQYEIFNMFDTAIIMADKGAVIYDGPANKCVNYFEELGFKLPAFVNPTDYFREIMAGNIQRPNDESFKPFKLLHYWDIKKREVGKPWSEVQAPVLTESGDEYVAPNVRDVEQQFLNKEKEKEKNRKVMGLLGQFFLYLFRSILDQLYHVKGLIFDFLFSFVLASALGAFYFNLEFIGPISTKLQAQCPLFMKDVCALPRKDNVGGLFLMTSGALAITACWCSVKLFQDKQMFKREATRGMNKLSYFLGKMTAQLPLLLLLPFIFLSAWYILVAPREMIYIYYGYFLLIWFTWSGIGYVISVLTSKMHALFSSCMLVIASCMVSGYYPTLEFLSQKWYTYGIACISPVRWSLEMLYLAEIHIYEQEGVEVQSAINYYGFDSSRTWLPIVILVGFGILFRLIAFVFLYFQDPNSKEAFRMILRMCLRKSSKKLKQLKEKRLKQKELVRASQVFLGKRRTLHLMTQEQESQPI